MTRGVVNISFFAVPCSYVVTLEHGWDFSGYSQISGFRYVFQKATKMALRCIFSVITHLSGLRLLSGLHHVRVIQLSYGMARGRQWWMVLWGLSYLSSYINSRIISLMYDVTTYTVVSSSLRAFSYSSLITFSTSLIYDVTRDTQLQVSLLLAVHFSRSGGARIACW